MTCVRIRQMEDRVATVVCISVWGQLFASWSPAK